MNLKPAILILALLLAGCAANTAEGCRHPGTSGPLTLESGTTIGVYLPPCYDSQSEHLYPVLYLLPGMGGTYHDWLDAGLAGMVDGHILNGLFPPLIVITTDHTGDDIAASFLIDEVIPYVGSTLRANPDRRYRAVAGGSLGGASAYFLAFQRPDLFASAGVFGNGLVTGMDAQTEAWLAAIPEASKPRIFLNSGKQDTYMLQQARALIPLLDRYGVEHTEVFEPGGHDYRTWLSNFPAYLLWLAEDWK